jgi:NADH-quinone oxidoreductase subunit K
MFKYLFLTIVLLVIGIIGTFLSRKHLLIILMSLELILLSSNINFIIFASYFDDILGQLYSLIILTIGAAEISIGLAILIIYFRLRGSVSIEIITMLKG